MIYIYIIEDTNGRGNKCRPFPKSSQNQLELQKPEISPVLHSRSWKRCKGFAKVMLWLFLADDTKEIPSGNLT